MFFVFLFLFPILVQAEPHHLGCFEHSAMKYGMSKEILLAIASVESSMNPKALHHNKNGSEDIGLMQINSLWLKDLASFGITREMLFDACINIDVAAWILAQHIKRYGYTWDAIGRYHSSSKELKNTYILKVSSRIRKTQKAD